MIIAQKKEVPTAKDYSTFVIIFSYMEINGENVPVMAICGKKSKRSYIIPLANAYQFADSITGEPTDYLVLTAKTVGEALNIGVDKHICYEICSAIVDNLPDLVEMPPAQQRSMMDLAKRDGVIIGLNGETMLDAS